MPTASDELRGKMEDYFGDPIDLVGPLKYLLDRGYKEQRGMLLPPTPDHIVTEKEWDCVCFLFEEWDFSFMGTANEQKAEN